MALFIDAAIDGKSYQQVADEQGIKIGTVMSRLNRARTQLRKELAEYAAARGYGNGADGAKPTRGRGRKPVAGVVAVVGGNKKPSKTVESDGDHELVANTAKGGA